jgi:hypothetical protein
MWSIFQVLPFRVGFCKHKARLEMPLSNKHASLETFSNYGHKKVFHQLSQKLKVNDTLTMLKLIAEGYSLFENVIDLLQRFRSLQLQLGLA